MKGKDHRQEPFFLLLYNIGKELFMPLMEPVEFSNGDGGLSPDLKFCGIVNNFHNCSLFLLLTVPYCKPDAKKPQVAALPFCTISSKIRLLFWQNSRYNKRSTVQYVEHRIQLHLPHIV